MWLQKTKNGKFQCVDRFYNPLTGSMEKVSVVIDRDTPQARNTAERTLQEKIRKKLELPAVTGTVTLQELTEAYLEDQKRSVKASTYVRNKYAMESIVSILGDRIRVDKLTAGYVKKMFLATDRTPGDLNEKLKRLKAALRWGYQNDLVETDITGKLSRFHDVPHREKIRDKYLTSEELNTLLAAMTYPDWNMFTRFLALSGLRFGEAAALRKKDVDLKNHVITISRTYDSLNRITTTPKTESSASEIFIQPELEAVCREINSFMLRRKLGFLLDTDLFFFGRNGKEANYSAYGKYLRQKSEEALGRKISSHYMRHTHASLMFEKGVDMETVSRRLRHKDSSITREIYVHVTKELEKKDAEKIRQIRLLSGE